MTSPYVLYETFKKPVYFRKLRQNNAYSRPIQTFSYNVAYLEPRVTHI